MDKGMTGYQQKSEDCIIHIQGRWTRRCVCLAPGDGGEVREQNRQVSFQNHKVKLSPGRGATCENT